MAFNLKYSAALKNAQQDAITAKIGASGLLLIYSGVQPTNPDTAITSQVLLATLTCNVTFAPASTGGVVTLNAISNGTGSAGAAGGTVATWYRLETSAGVPHVDGTVGITGCDINLNNTNIATGQTVSVTSLAYTNAQ